MGPPAVMCRPARGPWWLRHDNVQPWQITHAHLQLHLGTAEQAAKLTPCEIRSAWVARGVQHGVTEANAAIFMQLQVGIHLSLPMPEHV